MSKNEDLHVVVFWLVEENHCIGILENLTQGNVINLQDLNKNLRNTMIIIDQPKNFYFVSLQVEDG